MTPGGGYAKMDGPVDTMPDASEDAALATLLYRHPKGLSDGFISMDQADENIREAYRMGKESAVKK